MIFWILRGLLGYLSFGVIHVFYRKTWHNVISGYFDGLKETNNPDIDLDRLMFAIVYGLFLDVVCWPYNEYIGLGYDKEC
jgi:hypothetical protein